MSHPNKGNGTEKWTGAHTTLLAEAIIRLVQANRTALYDTPGIVGVVDAKGNSRTGAKVDALMTAFARMSGADVAVVGEGKKGKKRKAEGAGEGAKGRGKKRSKKVKSESEGAASV